MERVKKTVKIPNAIAAEVIYKSDLKCCVCQDKGVHIHHLNSIKFDHRIDNLAYLCFLHHDEATKKGGLSRKLSKETIIKFREQHYQVISHRREQSLLKLDNQITQLSEEQLLVASKNALIIMELENIKDEFFEANWNKRGDILSKIHKFTNHSNHRLAYEILDFLNQVSGQTRNGMTTGIAISVSTHVLNFSPSLYDKDSKEQSIELSKTCIHIGENIIYDAFIYLNNLSVAMWGFSIIKHIYRTAKSEKIKDLINEVNDTFNKLERTLRRPERTDLGYAQELLEIFRLDLEDWDLSFPILPKHLMKQVSIDENKKSKRSKTQKIK